MIDPECDHCGRDLDEDDLQNGSCVCGCALPYEARVALEKKYGPSGKESEP